MIAIYTKISTVKNVLQAVPKGTACILEGLFIQPLCYCVYSLVIFSQAPVGDSRLDIKVYSNFLPIVNTTFSAKLYKYAFAKKCRK
jgi:hypothetical protein